MGVQNVVTRLYMARNDIFAALFNYYVYDGRQILREENLIDANSVDSILLPEDKKKRKSLERCRDVLKRCVLKYVENVAYLLAGVENQ